MRDRVDELIHRYQYLNKLKLELFGLLELAKIGDFNSKLFAETYLSITEKYSDFLPIEATRAKIAAAQNSFKSLKESGNE